VSESLLKKFELFLHELGLSLKNYRLTNLKILNKPSAMELFYITDQQLEMLDNLKESSMDFTFGGLQLGWFTRIKNEERNYIMLFKPSLALIDSLDQESLPLIYLESKSGQSFLHGQDVPASRFNKPEIDNSIFLIYSEDILIGLGKIEKTGELKNITDKGRYLRSERKKHGVKSRKKTQ
jgi:hypothetical protein